MINLVSKKNQISGLALLVLILTCGTLSAQRVVLIGLDGFSSEAFSKIPHPNIDKLFANGLISLDTRPVMPSVTLPNWTSHLSGAGPEEHGVTNNNWTLAKHELQAMDSDKEGYFPSIFKVLKEAKPEIKTAFYYNWAELINSMNRKYLDVASFEEKDGYANNYAAAEKFILDNKKSPQLVFLYSVRIDHAGHGFKWMSKEYIDAVIEADKAIGGFVKDLEDNNLVKDTYFLLITDHGGKGTGHGGVSMEEMQIPWAITGPKIKATGVTQIFNSNKNTSRVIAEIFKIKDLPKSWTAVLPDGIFK